MGAETPAKSALAREFRPRPTKLVAGSLQQDKHSCLSTFLLCLRMFISRIKLLHYLQLKCTYGILLDKLEVVELWESVFRL